MRKLSAEKIRDCIISRDASKAKQFSAMQKCLCVLGIFLFAIMLKKQDWIRIAESLID